MKSQLIVVVSQMHKPLTFVNHEYINLLDDEFHNNCILLRFAKKPKSFLFSIVQPYI